MGHTVSSTFLRIPDLLPRRRDDSLSPFPLFMNKILLHRPTGDVVQGIIRSVEKSATNETGGLDH